MLGSLCRGGTLCFAGEEKTSVTNFLNNCIHLGSMVMAMSALGSSLSLRPQTARRGDLSGRIQCIARDAVHEIHHHYV